MTGISKCDKKYRSNDVVDFTKDIVFLLSEDEVGYADYDKALQLFRGGERNKYRQAEVCPGLTWWWWLRSPCAGSSAIARVLGTDGALYSGNAYDDDNGVRPAFIISDSIPVKKRKNGGYKFYWKEVTE